MKQLFFHILLASFLIILCDEAFAQKRRKTDAGELTSLRNREAEFHFTEGEKYFILEDYAKALVYYQKALEINAENATIHYKIAEVLSLSDKQDDLIRAAISIDQALKLEKQNKFFYLLAAEIYNGLSRFERAAEIYENLIKTISGCDEYLFELAAVYQYASKPEEAIKTYNRAEAVFGISEISSLQKQKIYISQNKTKEALDEGEKLIKAFPDEERYVVGHAEILSQLGQHEKAILFLKDYIDKNESAPASCMLLAGLYRDTDQEEKARALLLEIFDNPNVEFNSKLIVLSTYNEELNQSKSKGAVDKNKEEFTTQLFEKLALEYPNEPNVHILGGDLYLSINKFKDAQTEYLKAIDLGETTFEVWQNLLYLDIQLEQFELALRHSDRAIELFPNQSMIYYFNGFANLRLRKHKEAVQSLEQAKKLALSNPSLKSEINGMLGDAYNGTKEYDKSDKAYDEALSFNPNNNNVLNNYSFYLALRKANLEKAERMSSQLVKNFPDNATYLDTHAWVLFARQKYKEAKKIIEKAINTGKASAAHVEHYGDILFKLGEVDDAVQQWEKARGMLDVSSELLNKKIANRKIYE